MTTSLSDSHREMLVASGLNEEIIAELRSLRSWAQRVGLKLAQRAIEDALGTA